MRMWCLTRVQQLLPVLALLALFAASAVEAASYYMGGYFTY